MIRLQHGSKPFLLAAGLLAVAVVAVTAQEHRILGSVPPTSQQSKAAITVSPGEAEKVRMQLTERGIRDIRNLRREDDIYRADASWYGETVDIHVDAATGEVKQPMRLSSKQVEILLRDSGYHQIGQAERAGDRFSIEAQRNGQVFDLKIDAQTGRIIEAIERSSSQSRP